MTKILPHTKLAETINKNIWIIQSLSQADTSGFFLSFSVNQASNF